MTKIKDRIQKIMNFVAIIQLVMLTLFALGMMLTSVMESTFIDLILQIITVLLMSYSILFFIVPIILIIFGLYLIIINKEFNKTTARNVFFYFFTVSQMISFVVIAF